MNEHLKSSATKPLPIEGQPADLSSAHPWVRGMIGKDSDEVHRMLVSRWAEVARPLHIALRDHLSIYKPFKIAFDENIGYVLCRRKPSFGDLYGPCDFICVPQPLSEDQVESIASHFDSISRDVIREFLVNFAGIGEEMPDNAGQFVYDMSLMANDFSQRDDAAEAPKSARVLYWAANGDHLLIEPTGRTSWRVMETGDLVPLTNDFESFLTHYIDFRTAPGSESDPDFSPYFDSWGSRAKIKASVP